MQIKQISKYQNLLGEGSWWNNKTNQLHWTDIVQGKLYTYNPKTKHETFKKFDGKLGCFAPCKNGSFLIGLNLSFFIYDPVLDKTTKFLDLEKEPSENGINEGTTDPYGRFWVGTMTSEGHTKKKNGSLYCISPNKEIKRHLSQVYTSNGLAFNKLGTKMYFADTGKNVQTIWAFDYELKSGVPKNRKVFAKTNIKLQLQASSLSTWASPLPLPPRAEILVSSIERSNFSPGETRRLNRTLSIPPNNGKRPSKFGSESSV